MVRVVLGSLTIKLSLGWHMLSKEIKTGFTVSLFVKVNYRENNIKCLLML